jgi:hypothetical protein
MNGSDTKRIFSRTMSEQDFFKSLRKKTNSDFVKKNLKKLTFFTESMYSINFA